MCVIVFCAEGVTIRSFGNTFAIFDSVDFVMPKASYAERNCSENYESFLIKTKSQKMEVSLMKDANVI